MLESLKVALCSQRSQNCLPNVGLVRGHGYALQEQRQDRREVLPRHAGRIEGDDAVDAVFYGRGVNFAVRDVEVPVARHSRDATDGKGQVCAGARVAERKVELSVVKRRGDLLDRLVLGEVKRSTGALSHPDGRLPR